MDVRIGIVQSMKELDVELGEDVDRAALEADITAALSSGSVLWLTDRRGRRVAIPSERIAYVEFGGTEGGRRVGFGA
jgi:Protein of unknown function (DUF3107)